MKALRFVVAGIPVVLLLRVVAPRLSSLCMKVFEGMPEDSPPKRMAANLAAIRAQNEQIIALLQRSPE